MIEQTAARRDLEWNDLNIILAIGRAGSLSGAARALGKTHSTIFRNIKAIEQKTGVRFFDSFDHGYVPTDAGRTAIDYAERKGRSKVRPLSFSIAFVRSILGAWKAGGRRDA